MSWIINYDQMCAELGIRKDEKLARVVKLLHKEGYSDKSIFYAIGRNRNYLRTKTREHYFYGLLINTVRRNAHSKHDTAYWAEYNYQKRLKEDVDFAESQMKRKKAIDKQTIHKNGEKSNGRVYFVRAGEYVKIGFSTDAKSRIDSLQTGQPYDLECLCLIRGSRSTESKLHTRFAKSHVRGEWFSQSEELMQYIEKLKDTGMDVKYELKINRHKLGQPKFERGDAIRIEAINDTGLRLKNPTPTHLQGYIGQVLTHFVADDSTYAYDILLNDLFGEGAIEIVCVREENLTLLFKGNGEVR